MSLLVILLILYFLPTLIAFLRSHRQTTAVFVLNLFAGWTLIGGLVALEWACTTDVKPRAPTLLSKCWKSRDLVEFESEPRTPKRSFTKREWAAVAGLTVAITVFFFAAIALIGHAHAQQTTVRDSSGRTVGTITTDSAGTRTFRDGSGNTPGTSTRDSAGTITFRDSSGRTTGTASGPRR